MKDDFISRQAVIDILEKERFRFKKELPISYLLQEIIEQVERVPVVFDKEKVIEKLTERFIVCCDTPGIESECTDVEQVYQEGRSQGRYEAYLGAIKIVKKGGEI